MASNLYADDGLCHNAELGTYGHECSKPAVWLGTTPGGFTSGFCDDCKVNGYEARGMRDWRPHPRMAGETPAQRLTKLGFGFLARSA